MSIAAIVCRGFGPAASIPLIVTRGFGSSQAVVTVIDPDIARKIRKRRKELEAARLAAERAELRAKEIRRSSLRNMVLGITEEAQEVLAGVEPDKISEAAVQPMIASLNALALARNNEALEQRARATAEITEAFRRYLKMLEDDDEDDIAVLIMAMQ